MRGKGAQNTTGSGAATAAMFRALASGSCGHEHRPLPRSGSGARSKRACTGARRSGPGPTGGCSGAWPRGPAASGPAERSHRPCLPARGAVPVGPALGGGVRYLEAFGGSVQGASVHRPRSGPGQAPGRGELGVGMGDVGHGWPLTPGADLGRCTPVPEALSCRRLPAGRYPTSAVSTPGTCVRTGRARDRRTLQWPTAIVTHRSMSSSVISRPSTRTWKTAWAASSCAASASLPVT